MSKAKVGVRLRCEVCGAECIITKPGDAELGCCDAPLIVTVPPEES